jgi:hypothetical protein
MEDDMQNKLFFFLIVGFIVFIGVFIFIPIAFRKGRRKLQDRDTGADTGEAAGISSDAFPIQGRRSARYDKRAAMGGTIRTDFVFSATMWKILVIGGLLFVFGFVVLSLVL